MKGLIRPILVAIILFLGAFMLTHFLVGYETGGKSYVNKQRERRKSLRVGSHGGIYYFGHGPYSSGGPRFGK